jgi:hypothetical protein
MHDAVASTTVTAIVMRIEHISPERTFAEKNMSDLIGIPPKNPKGYQGLKKAAWADEFNFDKSALFWYHQNERQCSGDSNWGTRLYIMRVQGKPTRDQVLAVGEQLVSLYNATPRLNKKDLLCFDRNRYFWLPEPVVWSEVLGQNGALEELFRTLQIEEPPDSFFFQRNYKLIRCFFKPQSMSMEVANILQAPPSEVLQETDKTEVSSEVTPLSLNANQCNANSSYAPGYNPPRDDYFDLRIPRKKKNRDNEDSEEEVVDHGEHPMMEPGFLPKYPEYEPYEGENVEEGEYKNK